MNSHLEPYNFFVLRTPLLPFKVGIELTRDKKLEEIIGSDESLDTNVNLVRFALETSAAEFFQRAREKFDQKAKNSLIRYILRMSARPIPFGVFAGYSAGKLGGRTSINFTDPEDWIIYHKIDGKDVLKALREEASTSQELIHPHPSLTIEGKKLTVSKRILEEDGSTKEVRKLTLATNESGLEIFERLKRKGLKKAALLRGRSPEEKSYIEELLKHNILVPGISYDSYLGKSSWSEVKLGAARRDGTTLGARNLVLNKTCSENTLDTKSVEALARGVQMLNNLFAVQEFVKNKLSREVGQFCLSMEKKFPGKELSLIDALDPVFGVQDYYTVEKSGMEPFSSDFSAMERFFEEKILKSKDKLEELELKQEDLIQLQKFDEEHKYRWAKLPPAFTAVAEPFKGKLLLRSVTGTPSLQTLSRISVADDELSAHLADVAKWEDQRHENIIFAEIIDWPVTGKVANFSGRRLFYDYVIPLDHPISSVPMEKQLLLDDLMVSVSYGKVRLRSKKHNKEVIPVLSNFYNLAAEKNPFLKFLAQLAAQDNYRMSGWRWGNLRKQPYVPRVRVGNVILSLRQWRISATDVKAILKAKNPIEHFRALHQVTGMPQNFFWNFRGDLKLFVDVRSENMLTAAIDLLKTKWIETESYIEECAEDDIGTEYVLLFKNTTPFRQDPFPQLLKPQVNTRSELHLGDSCLYFKLYTNTGALDEVLTKDVAVFLKRPVVARSLSYWFFIKYDDTSPHLRVRLFLKDKKLLNDVLKELHLFQKSLFEKKRIWNFQIETYKRDFDGNENDNWKSFDRYSFIDSERALDLLTNLGFNSWSMDRKFLYLSFMAHTILKVTFTNLEERRAFAKLARVAYETMGYRAANGEKELFIDFWRTHRKEIMDFIRTGQHQEFGPHFRALSSALEKAKCKATQRMVHLSLNRSMSHISYAIEDQIYGLLFKAYMEESHA